MVAKSFDSNQKIEDLYEVLWPMSCSDYIHEANSLLLRRRRNIFRIVFRLFPGFSSPCPHAACLFWVRYIFLPQAKLTPHHSLVFHTPYDAADYSAEEVLHLSIRRSRIGLTPNPAQPTPSDAVRVRATLEPTKDKHAKEAGGKIKLESAASFQA